MIKIQTSIDTLFKFIEDNSPVKECHIPKSFRKLDPYEKYIRVLENNGLIEIKIPFFSNESLCI